MAPQLDQLAPADPKLVNIYNPYYRDNKRTMLPRALTLYQQKSLEGTRKIQGGENIPFVATWTISTLPADYTLCRMQFDNSGEQLSYEVRIENHVFVDFLIDLLDNFRRSRTVDFPTGFYRKLLSRD